MGCSSSTNSSAATASRTAQLAKRKSKESITSGNLKEDEQNRMKNDALQRHDTEIDFVSQLSAERQALRMVSNGKINRRLSCEDLMEMITSEEYHMINESLKHFQLQKLNMKGIIKEGKKYRKLKPWTVSVIKIYYAQY